MTMIGRILVLLVSISSLILMTWAVFTFTERGDWFRPTDKSIDLYGLRGNEPVADEEMGRLKRLQVRIEKLRQRRRDSEAMLNTNQRAVVALEAQRAQQREWYAGQLELATVGTYGGQQPQQVNPAAAGVIRKLPAAGEPLPFDETVVVRPEDVEQDANRQPLRAIDAYQREIPLQQAMQSTLREQIAKLIQEQEEATNQIIDLPDRRGLRSRILEQMAIDQASIEERNFLLPQIRNRMADVALVNDRRESLEGRITEVKKFNGVSDGR